MEAHIYLTRYFNTLLGEKKNYQQHLDYVMSHNLSVILNGNMKNCQFSQSKMKRKHFLIRIIAVHIYIMAIKIMKMRVVQNICAEEEKKW